VADSIGGPRFPRTGIQEGHLHFDKNNNILYVYNGGDPSVDSNWSEVGGSGASVGSSGGVQRWPFHFIGFEMSVTGGGAQAYFVAPAAGTITRWGLIVGSSSLPEDTIMQFYFDPFSAFTLVDSVTLLTGANNVKTERVISSVVAVGDVVAVIMANSYNPADNNVAFDGFVEFTPN